MTLLVGYLICAAVTWTALVADGVIGLMTPQGFYRSLRNDVEMFGPWRVALWGVLCLLCWWGVWFVWVSDWVDDT